MTEARTGALNGAPTEALWAHRPRPDAGSPVHGAWRGAATTPAELRALRIAHLRGTREQRAAARPRTGHFGPLLLSSGGAKFLDCTVAPPIGVPALAPPAVSEVRVSGPATLLAFTDGAVERRREDLDTGLERLRSTAVAVAALPLPAVLDRLMQIPTDNGGRDDTVILGLRWTT